MGIDDAILIFQFHKGTIRTSISTTRFRNFNLFQFHKGTIRTVILCLILKQLVHFNSIKVRLEQYLQT